MFSNQRSEGLRSDEIASSLFSFDLFSVYPYGEAWERLGGVHKKGWDTEKSFF